MGSCFLRDGFYEMEDVTFVYFDSRVGGMLGDVDGVLVERIVIFGCVHGPAAAAQYGRDEGKGGT